MKNAQPLPFAIMPSAPQGEAEWRGDGRPDWSFATLTGRLTELCGQGASAVLSVAFTVVLDAQERGETTAWISGRKSSFFPPDAHDSGIDLDALVVVRPKDARDVPRAGDHLLRSGAFGLVVIDLELGVDVPTPLQSRLLTLARKHDAAVLFLSDGRKDGSSLGSLVSLRARAQRKRHADGRFSCELLVTKDKRGAQAVIVNERFRGPPGLR